MAQANGYPNLGAAPADDDELVGWDTSAGEVVNITYANIKAGISAGTGDVTGAASSVDGEIVLMNGVTGKVIKSATTTGLLKATSGVLSAASAGTDYSTPGSTDTLTNKTIDANGTGNSITNIEVADLAATAVVTAAEGLASSDNDTSLPTTAAVIDGLDTKQPLDADLTAIAGLTATSDNFIQSKSSAWASRTPTEVTADLIAMVGDSGAGGTKGLVPAAAAGDAAASKYLKADGTWATVSASGGQTVVDYIVAASGGDYTTLGAALTAAAAGSTIWVKSGTYTESAITSSTANITIIGENPETTVIDIVATTFAHSGNFLQIQNIKFTATTGGLNLTGTDQRLVNVHIAKTGATTTGLNMSGARAYMAGCRVSSTVTTSLQHVTLSSDYGRYTGNYFELEPTHTTASMEVSSGNNGASFTGNVIKALATGTNKLVKFGAGERVTVAGNLIWCSTAASVAVVFDSPKGTFTGNTVRDGKRTLECGASCQFAVISGNNFYAATSASSTSMINFGSSSTYSNTFNGNYVYDNDSSRSASSFIDQSAANEAVSSCSGNYFYRSRTTGTDGVATLGNSTAFCGNYLYSGGALGIQLNGSYATVTGNTFNIASGNDIKVAANIQTITGNTIKQNKATPINFQTYININAYDNNGVAANGERRVLRMVNSSGATINAGNLVTWHATAAGNAITTTTTAGDTKLFGMAEAAINNGATGYILVKGHTTLLTVDGTTDIAVGDYITSFTTAGIGAKATAGQSAIAIALEAFTTDASTGVIDAIILEPRTA